MPWQLPLTGNRRGLILNDFALKQGLQRPRAACVRSLSRLSVAARSKWIFIWPEHCCAAVPVIHAPHSAAPLHPCSSAALQLCSSAPLRICAPKPLHRCSTAVRGLSYVDSMCAMPKGETPCRNETKTGNHGKSPCRAKCGRQGVGAAFLIPHCQPLL